jgi:hypothetical protein
MMSVWPSIRITRRIIKPSRERPTISVQPDAARNSNKTRENILSLRRPLRKKSFRRDGLYVPDASGNTTSRARQLAHLWNCTRAACGGFGEQSESRGDGHDAPVLDRPCSFDSRGCAGNGRSFSRPVSSGKRGSFQRAATCTRDSRRALCRFLGRRDGVLLHARLWPASEKRQGTKSRAVGR